MRRLLIFFEMRKADHTLVEIQYNARKAGPGIFWHTELNTEKLAGAFS